MTQALRGINLGGGLVAERWMAGDLFREVQGEGERSIGRELGSDKAKERLTRHRETYITESDFAWIAEKGFDFVRLPVGYWMFESDEGYIEGVRFVDEAFEWARRYRLKILLDFHGLQGSQNGQDHSGETGKLHFFRPWNRRKALSTLDLLTSRYGHEQALLAVEIINEPKVGFFTWRLMSYYRRAIVTVKRNCAPRVKVVVSDAFRPLEIARKLAQNGLGDEVVLDMHLYQVFGVQDKQLSFEEHIKRVNDDWRALINQVKEYVPCVLIGEWSAALPAEAYGERGETLSQAMKYYWAQRQLFDATTWAQCYWSYKAPGWGVWDYRATISKYDS